MGFRYNSLLLLIRPPVIFKLNTYPLLEVPPCAHTSTVDKSNGRPKYNVK